MTAAAPQACPCRSGKTYGSCCLKLWSQSFMASLIREPEFAGPQKLLDEAEVETPQGWRPISEVRHEAVGPDTQIRVKLSEFSQELARRMDQAGLYAEPQPHPSRRSAPPPPPRKRRAAQRKRKRR